VSDDPGQQDEPGYRWLYIVGRLAVIEEIRERRWKLAMGEDPDNPEQLPPLSFAVRDYERRLIEAAFARCNGNQSKAARLLGCTRRQLGYRVRQIGLTKEESILKRLIP
jgi:transcriptional regulator with GAF, ATPase, and Fis domain